MSNKEEIALKITLALIENGAATSTRGKSPIEYGKAAVQLYNSVLHGIDADNQSSK